MRFKICQVVGLTAVTLLLLLVAEQANCRNVLLPVVKTPHPYKDVRMPTISNIDIDKAFQTAKSKANERKAIERNLINENGILSDDKVSASARHQKNNVFMPESRELDNEQETFQQASSYLKESYHLSNEQATYGLPREDLRGSLEGRAAIQECQSMFNVRCPESVTRSRYRTADGSCNNLANPLWGKSFTCFARLVPPLYADGLSSPRVSSTSGDLPNPREISLKVHTDLNIPSNSYTHMTMQWGQFLDHDLTITPMNRAGPNMDMIECCGTTGTPHPECFPIALSTNDPFFSRFRETCMNFVRSATCTSDCTLGPRQQTNQLTAFIDASNVYGSTENDTRALRSFRNGKMLSQSSNGGDELLPPSRDINGDQCSRPLTNDICFQAGDGRVNEQPGLTAMQTLWLRQHNRVADNFGAYFTGASDENIFQEARRLIGAQMQMITYNEFLPVVLGPDYMDYYNLSVRSTGRTRYDARTQPSIVTEFSTAAYRFGHSLIQNHFTQFDGANQLDGIDLEDNYFFPFGAFNGQVEALLQGLFRQPAQLFDRHIVQAVTNHLYKPREAPFGMDLPALNIQRGRDHGVSGYTTYVDYCFDIKINSWSDLVKYTLMTTDNVKLLSNTYKTPDDIDLFTGGVSENRLPGGVVGPTFGCIIGLQFYHLKFGDRYYFEHANQAGSFNNGQLNQIRLTTLSQIICQNSNGRIPSVQFNAFLPPRSTFDCSTVGDIDYRYWA